MMAMFLTTSSDLMNKVTMGNGIRISPLLAFLLLAFLEINIVLTSGYPEMIVKSYSNGPMTPEATFNLRDGTSFNITCVDTSDNCSLSLNERVVLTTQKVTPWQNSFRYYYIYNGIIATLGINMDILCECRGARTTKTQLIVLPQLPITPPVGDTPSPVPKCDPRSVPQDPNIGHNTEHLRTGDSVDVNTQDPRPEQRRKGDSNTSIDGGMVVVGLLLGGMLITIIVIGLCVIRYQKLLIARVDSISTCSSCGGSSRVERLESAVNTSPGDSVQIRITHMNGQGAKDGEVDV